MTAAPCGIFLRGSLGCFIPLRLYFDVTGCRTEGKLLLFRELFCTFMFVAKSFRIVANCLLPFTTSVERAESCCLTTGLLTVPLIEFSLSVISISRSSRLWIFILLLF